MGKRWKYQKKTNAFETMETSQGDIGSIGDFAASAEVAFGTILQRTYVAWAERMNKILSSIALLKWKKPKNIRIIRIALKIWFLDVFLL